MHISDMSVTELQSIKRIHRRLLEELLSQSTSYQPLFNMCCSQELAKLKISTKLHYAYLQYVCNMLSHFTFRTPKCDNVIRPGKCENF